MKEDTHFQWAEDTQIQWAEEHDTAFEKLKATLTNSPVLQYCDPTVHITIQAYASQHRLGA